MRLAAAAALLLAAAPAWAEPPSAASLQTAPVVEARHARGFFYSGTHFGLQLDAGAPTGGSANLVVRPWKFLRLNAGGGYNLGGFGVKGGVTFVPWHWAIVPTFGLEVGRYFPGNFSRFAPAGDVGSQKLLSSVGYDFATADVGVEFGVQNRFVVFFRAGLSEILPTVKNVNAAVQAADPSLRVTVADPTIRARIPSGRAGILLYLF